MDISLFFYDRHYLEYKILYKNVYTSHLHFKKYSLVSKTMIAEEN